MMRQNEIKEFINHLFPKIVIRENLKLTYTFCFGGLALLSFLILIVTGTMLMFFFKPDPEQAYLSLVVIDSSVFCGRFVRTLHKISSHFFMALIFLHTLRVLFTGAFRKPRHNNWIVGTILFVLSFFEVFSGYLLPMEENGFWAVNASLNIIKKLPFGEFLTAIVAPDGLNGPYTMLRFYTMHVLVFPFLIILFILLHFYLVRKSKGVLPYL